MRCAVQRVQRQNGRGRSRDCSSRLQQQHVHFPVLSTSFPLLCDNPALFRYSSRCVRIANARKALLALLTSLDPSSTFSVYLFGSTCEAVTDISGASVIAATQENIRFVTDKVAQCGMLGGTELLAAVEHVMKNAVSNSRRHNVMILTDGEVSQRQSNGVKALLSPLCPSTALVGIIGIGNDVTRTTLRNVTEGGMGPQALVFDSDSEDVIASVVLGAMHALMSSQLRCIKWPGGNMLSSTPHVQVNSLEVQTSWALYPDEQQEAVEDEEWEVVGADGDERISAATPQVRWLDGSSISIVCVPLADEASASAQAAAQLPSLLISDHAAVKSMCITAALSRCRHPACSKHEATSLALRYGFVCSQADTVMVAVSDQPTGTPATSTFAVSVPSKGYHDHHDEDDSGPPLRIRIIHRGMQQIHAQQQSLTASDCGLEPGIDAHATDSVKLCSPSYHCTSSTYQPPSLECYDAADAPVLAIRRSKCCAPRTRQALPDQPASSADSGGASLLVQSPSNSSNKRSRADLIGAIHLKLRAGPLSKDQARQWIKELLDEFDVTHDHLKTTIMRQTEYRGEGESKQLMLRQSSAVGAAAACSGKVSLLDVLGAMCRRVPVRVGVGLHSLVVLCVLVCLCAHTRAHVILLPQRFMEPITPSSLEVP